MSHTNIPALSEIGLSRRDFMTAAALTVSFTDAKALVRIPDLPANHIMTYDGELHKVTSDWFTKYVKPHPHLLGMSHYTDHKLVIRTLQGISSLRREEAEFTRGRKPVDVHPFHHLSKTEQNEMQAAAWFLMLNRAWCNLQERHYREFGLVYLDQCHTNLTRYRCGCYTQHIFDHYELDAAAEQKRSPKTTKTHTIFACDGHLTITLRGLEFHLAALERVPIEEVTENSAMKITGV